jgi:hypothetical protein
MHRATRRHTRVNSGSRAACGKKRHCCVSLSCTPSIHAPRCARATMAAGPSACDGEPVVEPWLAFVAATVKV